MTIEKIPALEKLQKELKEDIELHILTDNAIYKVLYVAYITGKIDQLTETSKSINKLRKNKI